MIGQSFSTRWNFHLMAAKGYIVVAPNRRGLPGFGQAWNEQISGDWGGQAMKDMLWVTDSVKNYPSWMPGAWLRWAHPSGAIRFIGWRATTMGGSSPSLPIAAFTIWNPCLVRPKRFSFRNGT